MKNGTLDEIDIQILKILRDRKLMLQTHLIDKARPIVNLGYSSLYERVKLLLITGHIHRIEGDDPANSNRVRLIIAEKGRAAIRESGGRA